MDTRIAGKEKSLSQQLSEPYLADGHQHCGIRHHLRTKHKTKTAVLEKSSGCCLQRGAHGRGAARSGHGPTACHCSRALTRHKSKQTFLGDRRFVSHKL